MKEITLSSTPVLSLKIWHMITTDYERKLRDEHERIAYQNKLVADGLKAEEEANKCIADSKKEIERAERILDALFDVE